MRTRVAPLVLSLLLTIGSLVVPIRVNGQDLGCFPPDHGSSKSILAQVQKAVSDPHAAGIRRAMDLKEMDADSVKLITDSTLCNRARATIYASRGETPVPRRLVLVRIGKEYWAEDPSLRGGEFTDVYILDKELKKVIGRH